MSILEEAPKVEEVFGQKEVSFENASCEQVTFSYEDEVILKDYSISLPKEKLRYHGKSVQENLHSKIIYALLGFR